METKKHPSVELPPLPSSMFALESVCPREPAEVEQARLKVLAIFAAAIVGAMAVVDFFVGTGPSLLPMVVRGVVLLLTGAVWWSARSAWPLPARDRVVAAWLGAFLVLLGVASLDRPVDAMADLALAPIAIIGVMTLLPIGCRVAFSVCSGWAAMTWWVATYVRDLSAFDYVVLVMGVFVSFWMAIKVRRETMTRRADAHRLTERIAELRALTRICAWCRQLKGPDDEWSDMESFLEKFDYSVTHGMCPTCAAEAHDEIVQASPV